MTLDKKEAIEGGVVLVNCSVPEERPPIHFTVEKYELNIKDTKLKREKTSHYHNFVTMEYPVEEQDKIIFFQCLASIASGTHMETSSTSRSDMVTVTGTIGLIYLRFMLEAGEKGMELLVGPCLHDRSSNRLSILGKVYHCAAETCCVYIIDTWV